MVPNVNFTEIRRDDGTRLVVATQGAGPLVLMVHGFPESWISWRHQFEPIASAGFTAAALQTRGYGDSDKPSEIEAYSMREMAADIVAVIDALGKGAGVLIGHDWGAVQVQGTTIMHPDKVLALVTLSVPVLWPMAMKPSELWNQIYPDKLFYQTYFREAGRAEAELDADPGRFLRLFYYSLSGDREDDASALIRPGSATSLLEGLVDPQPFPAWLTPDELDYYTKSFESGGFRGPLNRYRAQDIDFVEMAPFGDRRIAQPTLFVGGARDPSRFVFPGTDLYADPLARCDHPRGAHILQGIGHWIQQEAPEAVNRLILSFLDSVRTATRPPAI